MQLAYTWQLPPKKKMFQRNCTDPAKKHRSTEHHASSCFAMGITQHSQSGLDMVGAQYLPDPSHRRDVTSMLKSSCLEVHGRVSLCCKPVQALLSPNYLLWNMARQRAGMKRTEHLSHRFSLSYSPRP